MVPLGRGGLFAGIAEPLKAARPRMEIFGVLPQAHHWKLRQTAPPRGFTIADALVPAGPARSVEPIVRRLADGIVETTDAQVLAALRALAEETKLIAEPAAAVALAPLLSGAIRPRHPKVVCLLAGGNVTVSRLNKLLVGH